MEYQTYLNEKKELYNILLQFLECQTAEDYSEHYQNLTYIFRNQKIDKNKEETALVLHLLVQISNNHRRIPDFINKIQQILQLLFNIIKTTFTNSELFNIMKNNKLIMLFFIKNQILSIDKEIFEKLLIINPKSRTKYHYFFYPEIKKFLENKEIEKIDQELAQYNPNIFIYFDERRKIGENESYICELIRNDSIQDFITLITRENYSVNKGIEDSIFETNPFLMENKPSLIEYAAFFGSIQVFQYLKINNAEMNPSLWLYAIHGQNAEIIHHLESESVPLPDCKYNKCVSESIKLQFEYRKSKFISLDKSNNNLITEFLLNNKIFNFENNIQLQPNDPYFILTYESIKCHHNEFAKYFQVNFLNDNEIDYKMTFKYYNFDQIPNNINDDSIFYYLCNYDYSEMINLYLLPKNADKCIDITSTYKYLQKYQISKISDNKNSCGLINQHLLIQQIALPPCITEIGNNAFYSFYFLNCISIPSSVTSIGEYAFFDCRFLEHITIPFSVTYIGNYAFQGCILLKKITLPPSINSINDYTFSGCLSLRKITIPSSVKSIGEGTFKGCLSLKEITIPSSVKSIGDYAFSGCYSLTDDSVPKSVTFLKKHTFQDCYHLKDYYLSDEEPSFYCWGIITFWSIFSFLFANLLIVFIVALVWWFRIHPWFSHGYKTGKTVYQSLLTCWISFIIGIFVFLLYLLYKLIIENCSMSIIARKKKNFYLKLKLVSCIVAYIITISLFLITIISAMVASTYALKNEKNNGESLKCLRYILDGYQGAVDWVTNQSLEKQNDLNKWHSNMLDKAFKNDGSVTNYYCLNMGATIMTFAIIAFLFIIGSIISFIMMEYEIPFC